MSEQLCVVVNAFIYLLFIYFYTKNRNYKLNCGVYLLSVWTFSALGAVLYEPFNFIGHWKEITLLPYIILLGYNILLFIPVLSFSDERIVSITVDYKKLFKIGYLLLFISIVPFAENLYYYINHHGNQTELLDKFNELHQDSSVMWSHLSSTARRLTFVLQSLRTLSVFLLLYLPVFHNRKGFKLAYAGCLLSVGVIILESLNILQRFLLITNAMYIIMIYIVLRRLYEPTLYDRIKKYLGYAAIGFSIIVVGQTIVRYANYTDNLNGQSVGQMLYYGQYISEGMGNFNADVFYSYARKPEYDPIVQPFLKLLGVESSGKAYNEHNFIEILFFTVTGDYWRYYGPIGTLLLYLIFALLIPKIVKVDKNGNVNFTTLLLFFMYMKIPLTGIFYHIYVHEYLQLFTLPFVYLYLKGGDRNTL